MYNAKMSDECSTDESSYEEDILNSLLQYLKTKNEFSSYGIFYNRDGSIYKLTLLGNVVVSTLEFDTDNFIISLTTEVLGTDYAIKIPNIYVNNVKFIVHKFIESYSCAITYSKMKNI